MKVKASLGNVFRDLGLPDADERLTKVKLALALNRILAGLGLSQVEAAERLGINQPKVSALKNYKLAGFSVERMLGFLTALNCDVEIVIKAPSKSARTGRVKVHAA